MNGSCLAIDRLILAICGYYYDEKNNKLIIPEHLAVATGGDEDEDATNTRSDGLLAAAANLASQSVLSMQSLDPIA